MPPESEGTRKPEPTLAPTLGGPAAAPAPLVAPGRVGPYRVLSELGHGGMGAVYLAVRADEQYQKRVAIKVIKWGMGTEDVVRHFRRERQILAGLEHQNIAKLLDGGTTEEGLPYFVMEYVEGQAIDRYCDNRRLPTAERLRLFRSVCAAVQHAHRNLVVHRDIKPRNVLVTADGVVKLLDFGIAKLLNPELAVEGATATRMAMTPDYASPEQVKGDPITTSSDVYSLGVVLYELVTGRRPYRVRSQQALDVLRAVCEEEPQKPSTAVDRTEVGEAGSAPTPQSIALTRDGSPEKLRRRLRGDLDTIVMTALMKEPQRRYPSVEALSEDLRRYVEGRPIAARKATFAYRGLKFVRRNKGAVGAAAAIVALVAGFAVNTALQSARVSRERDKAERVAAFLVDLFKVSDPSEARGNSITAREVLDKGAEQISRELKDQPDVRATLMATMGGVYQSLGLYDRAAELLEEALRVRKGAPGGQGAEVARSQGALGALLMDKGDYGRAEALLREALATQRTLLGKEHAEIAMSLHGLGSVLYARGDYDGAEPLFREALTMRRKVLGPRDVKVADSLNNLANVLYEKGDYAAAEPVYREALETYRLNGGNEHPAVAKVLHNLAGVLFAKGDYDGAEALHREALRIRTRILGGDHPALAANKTSLAITLVGKGDYAAAEALYREALATQRRRLGNEHADVAFTLMCLGEVRYFEGDYAAAETLYREALAMQRKLLGEKHPDVAMTLGSLGNVLDEAGDRGGAEAAQRQALAIRQEHFGREHIYVSLSLVGLATTLRHKGDAAAAEALYRESVAMDRKLLGSRHPHLVEGLAGLAGLLAETGRRGEAETLAREAVDLGRSSFPRGDARTAEAESVLGACLAAAGRHPEAEPLLRGAYEALRAKRSDASWEAREAKVRLAALRSGARAPSPAP